MAEGSAPNIVQICRRMLTANEGQNRFGEVAGPFLSFLQDYADYNDFRYVCKKQMGLDKVFYVLDPASGALTTLDAVDGALLEEAVRVSGSLSDSLLEEEEPPVLERTLSEPVFPDSLMDCAPSSLEPVLGRSLSEYH